MMVVGNILLLLIINFLIINLYFHLATYWKVVDIPNERSSHENLTIRGGGIIFPIAWFLYSFWNGFTDLYISLAVLLVSVVSFVDDVKPQRPIVRLLFHVSAFLLVCQEFSLIESFGILSIIPVLVLGIGILNAVNFMDGINGMSVLYFGVFLGSIGLFVQRTFSHEAALWSLESPFTYFFAALATFAFYNLRRRAKTFAGDVGSVSLGLFILIFLLMYGFERSDCSSSFDEVFNWQLIFFLAIYGIDTILTIMQRYLNKENIFKAHRSHLYQLLVNEFGMSHLSVASIYSGFQLIFNVYIIYWAQGLWTLTVFCLLLGLIYLVLKKRIAD